MKPVFCNKSVGHSK